MTKDEHKAAVRKLANACHASILEAINERNLFMAEASAHAEGEFRRKELELITEFNDQIADLCFTTFVTDPQP